MSKQTFEMVLEPQWSEVERARLMCIEFLKSNKITIDVIDAITMICSELVENAVKYGDFISSKHKIQLTIIIGHLEITLKAC